MYKYCILSILDETIDFDKIISVTFAFHFYVTTSKPWRYLLYPMLKVLLLQLVFSIPTAFLLNVFLKYSQELRDFCGFDVVSDASKFTRFKQDFPVLLLPAWEWFTFLNNIISALTSCPPYLFCFYTLKSCYLHTPS